MGNKPALKQNHDLNQFLAQSQQPKKDSFNYSLCESVDYQKESLLGNNYQAPQNSYYTLEQVASLLNQQRDDLEKRQQPQPVMRVQSPVQQQPISFGYKFGQAPVPQVYQAPTMIFQQADIESNQTGVITNQNNLF
jgi:hypothetical protein